jgi:hypothetical protein
LTDHIVALIKQMACHLPIACHLPMAEENRTWGPERIRGELLKLGVQVCKTAIQEARGPRSPSQTWVTHLRNHAREIWACGFLQTYDLLFRRVFVRVVDT